MPTTAFKLIRTIFCLAGGVFAVALIVVAAVGSAFLAAALVVRSAAGEARTRADSRTSPARTTPRPRSAQGAQTIA